MEFIFLKLVRSVWLIPAIIAFTAADTMAACDCGSVDSANPCTGTSISVTVQGDSRYEGGRSVQFDWSFHSGGSPANCGQFANGDYWIAPASGQNSVTVTGINGSGSGTIYADENPVPEAMGLLSRDYGNQDSNENIITRLPLSWNRDTSLVAVIERDEATHGECGTRAIVGCCADAYSIVTVLEQVPPEAGANSLRPSITETEKELLSLDDFDLTRISDESFLTGTDAEGLEEIRQVWSHHIEILSMRDIEGNGYSEGGRAFRAELVTHNYAAGTAQHWHNHLMQLMSADNSLEEKKAALAAVLTYGKDIFYHVYTPTGERERWFGAGAGQSLGRFPPAVLFAALAKDPFYGDTLKLASSTQVNIDGLSIHELDQANIGPNGPVWGDHDTFDNKYDVGRYWGEILNNQAFDGASGNFDGVIGGKKTFRDPYLYIDGPGARPGGLYAGDVAGPMRALAAEMLLMPEVCEIVNYDALVEYAIRITAVGIQTANDPCAPPDPREDPAGCDTYRARGCKYYGLSWDPHVTDKPTWGPDPEPIQNSNDWSKCILNGLDPITGVPQNGRYSTRHGSTFSIGYRVGQVEENWDAIVADRHSCRNLSRPSAPTSLRVGSSE